MEKLKYKTMKCTAGTGRLLLYAVIIMEFISGALFIGFGFTGGNTVFIALGLLIACVALFSAAGTNLAPPGEKLINIGKGKFYISKYIGNSVNEDNFLWINKTEIIERAGKKTLIIYADRNLMNENFNGTKSFRKKENNGNNTIVISQTRIENLGVNKIDIDELNDCININRLIEKVDSLSDDSLLSSKLSIGNGAHLYMAGKEAQVCNNGLLLKVVGDDDVILFSDKDLKTVSVMVDKEKTKKEIVVILLYDPMNFLLISSEDTVYQLLIDGLVNMNGFDSNAFNEAMRKAENILCTCYSRDSEIFPKEKLLPHEIV